MLSCFEVSFSISLCLIIRLFAIGPPSIEPAISPKVADAIATASAPFIPRASILGAIAAEVPCPPVIGVDPVINARSGLIPTNPERRTATRFCAKHKPMARRRKINTFFPPFFRTFKLALNPTLVKNITIKNVCNVVSNFIVIILDCLSIKAIIEKRNPPITGDGIQYFSKNLTLLLSFIPIISKITDKPIV